MKLVTGSSPLTALLLLQIGLTILCIVIAFVYPAMGGRFFSWIENILRRIARRRLAPVLVVAILPLALRALLLPVYGVPMPAVHDEFAYLLQGDTFASGRLTNPPPPSPKHFESLYILTEPTYNSQYEPAQGLLLALGDWLFNLPWLGVFLSMGVLSALFYWMLRAWVSPVWALVGALLAIFQYGVLSYWMNSYFGGSVPAIGGTLALGALARLRAHAAIREAVLWAVGIVILMNSRPSEGALLMLVSAGALLYWFLVKRPIPFGAAFRRVLVPMGAVLILGGGFEMYYNYRVTGKPTELPYMLSRKLYGTVQGYFFEKAYYVTTPMPRDIRMEYQKQLDMHARRKSLRGLAAATVGRLRTFWTFYLGPALTIPLLFLPFIWRRPNMGIVAASLIVVGFDNLTFHAYEPHYSAPVACLILLVVVLCFERLRHTGPAGLFLSRSLPIVCALSLLIPMFGRWIQPALPAQLSGVNRLWDSEFQRPFPREQLRAQLLKQGGKDLVFVRYRYPEHDLDNEWVFNRANLDQAKIIWARELDPESDRRLIERFPGRKIWLGEPDLKPPRIIPYPKATGVWP
ncbi:MAG TPA: hypothetical protein VFB14_16380 [Bryobacteraceae bacterium]|nr:hypothetical protein [Bryobacteraceae bacterium]